MRTAFDCLLPAGGRVNRGVAGCFAKRGVNEISSAAIKPGVYIYVLGNNSGQIVQTGKLMVE